jgi:hypothetical protein
MDDPGGFAPSEVKGDRGLDHRHLPASPSRPSLVIFDNSTNHAEWRLFTWLS